MTPALRKYHRIFWLGSIILMPVLFIASIVFMPETAEDPIRRSYQIEVLPNIVQQVREDEFDMTIRADAMDSVRQLEVLLKKPLSAPEVLIYMQDNVDASVTNGVFIGKLSSVGVYRFQLGTGQLPVPLVFRMYDPIHQANYSTIEF